MSTLPRFAHTSELLTLRDWLRYAVSTFTEAKLSFGHGSLSAYDEAAYLLLHSLHLPLDTLDPFLDARLTAQEKSTLLELLKRRVEQRIPAAYLTHEAWLGEFKFYVDERVIVPRSFIAELLRDRLFPWVADAENTNTVLDLCTGSGCLAILAAAAFPNAMVEAVDLSNEALQVAERNVSDYELQDRIISNPPYVNASSVAALPPEYLHEPKLALGSGNDGLDATREILKQAATHLTAHGILVVEIGHNRDALEAAFPDLPFTWLEVSAGAEFVFLLHRNDLV
jgi:ribosomal protein L3 glutamine methyltransferase